ncbi:hypothetical protein EVAR_53586_1 [Eumeta japonica]|uniref:Uncharacterized protein n=1 Tax=Eumeta variegata TaxID=151549 RepID=A0A4C1YMI4_EUMVA|nr:hypothetical protein EVAR_53586_1 [Eumeta japonica]
MFSISFSAKVQADDELAISSAEAHTLDSEEEVVWKSSATSGECVAFEPASMGCQGDAVPRTEWHHVVYRLRR